MFTSAFGAWPLRYALTVLVFPRASLVSFLGTGLPGCRGCTTIRITHASTRSMTTRAQKGALHVKLLRRIENFTSVNHHSLVLKNLALQLLKDHPPEADHEPEDIVNVVCFLLPSYRELFIPEFLKAPVYLVSLLRDVCSFYECLRMDVDVKRAMKDGYKTDRVIEMFAWIASTIYNTETVQIGTILDRVMEIPGSSILDVIDDPRHSLPGLSNPPSCDYSSYEDNGDNQKCGDERRQESSPAKDRRITNHSTLDSAKTLGIIYGAFKDKTFSGDSLQPLEESVRDYNILCDQLNLTEFERSRYFICIFEDAEKSHFIANCNIR